MKFKCLNCGKEFEVFPSAIKSGKSKGKYCCWNCYIEARGEIERKCLFCGKAFKTKRVYVEMGYGNYCNSNCYGKAKSQKALQAYESKANPKYKGIKILVGKYPSGQKRYRYEHTLVVEKVLGRSIKPFEDVHHINGNKTDNRNSNLLVCSKSYHTWLHNKMSELYMQEHFN